MVKCYLCHEQYNEKKLYMAHLKLHSYEGRIMEPSFCFDCHTEPRFENTSALGKHLLKFHFTDQGKVPSEQMGERVSKPMSESVADSEFEPAMEWEHNLCAKEGNSKKIP
jgi:hypothetical protein